MRAAFPWKNICTQNPRLTMSTFSFVKENIFFFCFHTTHKPHGRKKYYLRIMFGHSYWTNTHSEILWFLFSLICLLTFLPLMLHADDWPNLNGHGKKRIKQGRIPGQGHIRLSIADAESLNAFKGKNLILGYGVIFTD